MHDVEVRRDFNKKCGENNREGRSLTLLPLPCCTSVCDLLFYKLEVPELKVDTFNFNRPTLLALSKL